MELRDDIRHTLAKEFEFAVSKMEQSQGSFADFLYYYSAFYGALNRAFNLTWDRELSLLYMVTHYSYREMHGLIDVGRHKWLPPEVPGHLTSACKELARLFAENTLTRENLYPVLARISEVSYATTGNGFYNLDKGNLRL